MQIMEYSLLHWRVQGRISSQPRTPTSFCENLYTLSVRAQTHSPDSLKLVWKKEKKDTIKVNLWFICLKPR